MVLASSHWVDAVPQAVTLAFIILLPMPLYGTRYIFSRPFFRLWVVWTFAWAWAAGLVITLLPLWQGRRTLWLMISHVLSSQAVSTDRSGSTEESAMRQSSEGVDEKKANSDVESATGNIAVVPMR